MKDIFQSGHADCSVHGITLYVYERTTGLNDFSVNEAAAGGQVTGKELPAMLSRITVIRLH